MRDRGWRSFGEEDKQRIVGRRTLAVYGAGYAAMGFASHPGRAAPKRGKALQIRAARQKAAAQWNNPGEIKRYRWRMPVGSMPGDDRPSPICQSPKPTSPMRA
jgi:hypothetical protein